MADISMACNRLGSTCREVHIVATGGECKELLIWMDSQWNSEYSVKSVELRQNSETDTFAFTPSEEYASTADLWNSDKFSPTDTEAFLFEPGKALMKAGAYNLISTRFKISKLGKSTHYYLTGDSDIAEILKKYGKVYSIIDYQPLDKRSIKEMGNKFPKAEVTARNIPMDTDSLRKKLGITSGDDAHIFGLKSDTVGNILIAGKRIH